MFGRRQKEEREELQALLAELVQDRELYRKAQEEASKEQEETRRELGRELAACREQIDLSGKDVERQLKRHSEAIEDLLDERKTQDTVIERYEHQVREGGEREDRLLSLLCRYQEELALIEEKLRSMDRQHAEDWSDQLALFKKSLEGELRRCSIEETGKPGEPVDYRYHEILDAADTEEAERDGTVAYCYRPGCVYRGKVITKAQVRAYRRVAANP